MISNSSILCYFYKKIRGSVSKIIVLLIFVILNGCHFFKNQNEPSSKFLTDHITALVSTDKPRNYKNIESLNQAADYIEKNDENVFRSRFSARI
jgi:hypothetical protein